MYTYMHTYIHAHTYKYIFTHREIHTHTPHTHTTTTTHTHTQRVALCTHDGPSCPHVNAGQSMRRDKSYKQNTMAEVPDT